MGFGILMIWLGGILIGIGIGIRIGRWLQINDDTPENASKIADQFDNKL